MTRPDGTIGAGGAGGADTVVDETDGGGGTVGGPWLGNVGVDGAPELVGKVPPLGRPCWTAGEGCDAGMSDVTGWADV